jgi:hypothetical protein
LWYIVGSFNQAGTLTLRSAAAGNSGVYGKDALFTAGKARLPSA